MDNSWIRARISKQSILKFAEKRELMHAVVVLVSMRLSSAILESVPDDPYYQEFHRGSFEMGVHSTKLGSAVSR